MVITQVEKGVVFSKKVAGEAVDKLKSADKAIDKFAADSMEKVRKLFGPHIGNPNIASASREATKRANQGTTFFDEVIAREAAAKPLPNPRIEGVKKVLSTGPSSLANDTAVPILANGFQKNLGLPLRTPKGKGGPNIGPSLSTSQPQSFNESLRILRNKKGRVTGVTNTQRHHIISDKNEWTKNHELWRLAGISPENSINKILLPTTKGASLSTTKRSIHQGRHLDQISKSLAKKMTDAVEEGAFKQWTQSQYGQKLKNIIQTERKALKAGEVALNKNKRDWTQ